MHYLTVYLLEIVLQRGDRISEIVELHMSKSHLVNPVILKVIKLVSCLTRFISSIRVNLYLKNSSDPVLIFQ